MNSSGKLPTIEACKRTCENSPECQSIMFFKTGWCNHFKTPCVATTRRGNAKAMRLIRGGPTEVVPNTAATHTPTKMTHATTTTFSWVKKAFGYTCSTAAGEELIRSFATGFDLATCQRSCANTAVCKGYAIPL